jgi:dihydroxyacetone kinase-like protein
MKKLINNPDNYVRESLEGMALAHPELIKIHFEPHFIYRADAPVQNKVALVSGGGSGHEPLHGGFVGVGMLDAACPGEVFTSPTPDQMLEAAKVVNSGAGVLNIVKNYSGDVMNFELAAELALSEGIRVLNILIDDDVAVKDSLYTQGRRGVGTTILAEKICGAAAGQGYDLKQLANLCRRVNLNGRSMGMALTSCTPPVKGSPMFELGEKEIEFGIGIHGEPGRQRLPLASADEIAEMLALSIIEDNAYTRIVREWDEEK